MRSAELADEGGVSFWLPGQFGSLAAVPQQPGWSLATVYYHASVDAGGDVAFARQVTRGGITVNFPGILNASLKGDANLALVVPSYVFASPVLGGQFALSGGRGHLKFLRYANIQQRNPILHRLQRESAEN